MKTIVYLLLLPLFLFFQSCEPDPQEEKIATDWIQLFNGENLAGWDIKIRGYELNRNNKNTFRIEDGYLSVGYDEYTSFDESFGHIFYKEPFSYYHLAVEYRFVGEQCAEGPGWAIRNSGMMIHSQSAKSMGLDQDFPISIEVQLLGGNGTDPRSNCNLCTPGTNVVMGDTLFTRHCINSTSKTYHGEQWVRAEVIAYGDSLIKHIVEGDTVLSYNKPQIGGGNVSGHEVYAKEDGKLLTGGYISLQSESHPIQFRKVELLNLEGCMDRKAKNYKAHYVKADNSKCKY